ncbi:phage tail protein [Aetokthonos hydrillicola Thurmond2011]|jgi:phage-related protein|uniref:Phage tail protein n=1 Tax=Aetokthonos hydrillicola Thurmond2011 TaxID=2712845 RepID=A0AAP5IIM5_9CYAN|nr:phage tail protein [Aetokthonos hydrillicola]MBO3459944.1 phage tail protein [Aetokthonos hydrillicola CCALA 1050]MBW4584063.1 phage tail protein [Aetokthonos hydrillicola CCALA 1050]MDR9900705.1 phage tail protein [Aetokthonos hydrillicola Thurmond2011]
MPIAILELPPTWEATKKVTVPATITKLGDGYEQVVVEGTTGAIEQWDVRSPAMPPNTAQDKLNQLRVFSGVSPFFWSPDNGLRITRKTFTCEGWTLTRLGLPGHQISATFKQVF